MSTETVYLLTPEIVLLATAVAIYMGGAFFAARQAWNWIAGAALVVVGLTLWTQHYPATDQAVMVDSLARSMRWLALALAAALLLVQARPLQTGNESEKVASLLLTIVGLMAVAQAADLVLLFVSLELISIPTYVLLYLGRNDDPSREAAAKYFFLSILASAILLYGFSFLYGVGGSTQLAAIAAALRGGADAAAALAPLAPAAMVLIFAGLCFKLTAVPFHFYAPDVYQGTTHSNAALLSVIPKAAALIALVRLLVLAMPPAIVPYSWHVVVLGAVLTMTVGNVMALWQDDLRRLLAYSAIAHAGYLLIGLAVAIVQSNTAGGWNGQGALWFYFATYAAATVGAFAVFEALGRFDRRIDSVNELAGLSHTAPGFAALLAVFMFSLAGIPVLAGFWGKFLIFGSALNVGDTGANTHLWFIALAVVGVLNAAIGAAYYLRIVAVMYFREPLATLRPAGGYAARWAAIACALVVIGFGLFPYPLIRAADWAAQPRPAVTVAPQASLLPPAQHGSAAVE